jgi:hypothetical protein
MPGSDTGVGGGSPAYTLVDAITSKRLPTKDDTFIDPSFEKADLAESSRYFLRFRIATTIAATAPIASNSSMPGSDTAISSPAYTLVDAITSKRLPTKDDNFIDPSFEKS